MLSKIIHKIYIAVSQSSKKYLLLRLWCVNYVSFIRHNGSLTILKVLLIYSINFYLIQPFQRKKNI